MKKAPKGSCSVKCQEKEIQHNTHIKFQEKYGGKVFYIYSCKSNDKKIIVNIYVIDEIKEEIKRLQSL